MALSLTAIGAGALQRGFGAGNVRAIAEQYVNDLLRSQYPAYQHALLGDVAFDLITYFSGSETKSAAEFAEHKLIDGKPRLQWVGDKLDEINWSLVFHAGFCDPEAELQKLKKLIAGHVAAPLHYSSGDYKGTFVPTECTVTNRQTMRDGTLVWLEASVSLKEYVQPPVLVEQTPSQQPVAAQTRAADGTRKPPRTVKKAPKARPITSPICRN